MKRRHKIDSAMGLFLALAMYVMMELSQRVLSAVFADNIEISDQAWQKNVRCEPWLSHILSEVMPKLSKKNKQPFRKRTVKLIDASIFQQASHKNGRGGKSLRLHPCYNLTEGKMEGIALTDNTVAESVSHFSVERGCLYIADTGYGKGKQLLHITQHHADVLFRVTPHNLKLAEDIRGRSKINMSEKLVYAEWVILMASLPDEYTAEELLKMYRARWQIELLFKRIKQSIKVTKLRPASLEHSKVSVLIMLILWAIIEQHVLGAELFLLEKGADMSRYSSWATGRLSFINSNQSLAS